MHTSQLRLVRHFLEGLEPLWVSGLALFILFLGDRLLPLEGEQFEWAEYLLLGIVLPTLVLVASLVMRSRGILSAPLQVLQWVWAGFCVVWAVQFWIHHFRYEVLVISVIQWLILLTWPGRGLRVNIGSDWGSRLSWYVVSFWVTFVSWNVAVRLLYWMSFREWISASHYSFLVFVGAWLLVFFNVCLGRENQQEVRFRFWSVENVAAFAIFATASLHIERQFLSSNVLYHWSYFTGPADLVRQGGWLLWDVPSTYGFLSILTIAFSPAGTTWHSLFIVYSVLLLLTACFLFYLLRSLRTGWANFCLALSLTLAAVFLMPGWAPSLGGPQSYPSVSAFRFVWVYALLGILVWGSRRISKAGDPIREVALLGSVTWVIGTLWSAESAVYSAATWLPAYAVIVLQRVLSGHPLRRRLGESIRAVVPWLLLPFVLLVSTVGVITVYYAVRLGHCPDWRAFWECALSYAAGFFALPIKLDGAIWILLMIFCVLMTAIAYLLREDSYHTALAPIVGACGALWAVSSYCISRSHGNNFTNLAPVYVTVTALLFYVFLRFRPGRVWTVLSQIAIVPIWVIVLTATFGNMTGMADYISSPVMTHHEQIDQRFSAIPASLADLLHKAQVKPSDQVVFLSDSVLIGWLDEIDGRRVLYAPAAWLPASPLTRLRDLSVPRRLTYLSRFVDRIRSGGWLVVEASGGYRDSMEWLLDQVLFTHKPVQVKTNAEWRLTRFELQDQPPENPQTFVDASTGETVELLRYGSSLIDRTVKRGKEDLAVRLYWQVTEPIAAGQYAVFFHVRDRSQWTIAQADWPDLSSVTFEEEEAVVSRHEVPIPGDTPEGEFEIRVGIYRPDTMERLAVTEDVSGENAIILDKFAVIRP